MPKKIELPIDEIIKKYYLGFSSKQLAVEYKCATITLQRRMRKFGCIFRELGHGCKKYSLNEKYFDVIDTENKAYWLGIFLTDGSTSSKIVRLKLMKSDESHLRKFLNDIESNHPISYEYKDEFVQACVNIGNKYMWQQLVNKGIIANNKRVYSLPSNLEKDYWRGVIDGDGSISGKNKELRLIGTKETCIKFQKFCKKNSITKANIHKVKNKNIWHFELHGDIAFKIANILYNNSSVYLHRKFSIYDEWKKSYIDKPLYPFVVRFFKSKLPQKIQINRCKMTATCEGDCTFKNNKYYIRINKRLNDSESINCLLHELSHIETIFEQNNPHGQAFGKAYAKIYKMYEKEFTNC